MIVVSDSSPLNYLVLIGQVDLLFKIYGQVVVPPAVDRELQRESTLRAVRQWMAQPPHWLRVQQPRLPADAALDRLGQGEREAIT